MEQILDGMAYNKLNVFHWHIVDDHSFPYQSIKYPEMTKGAFHESMIYSQHNIAQIIEYAKQRGIRVMAEFDTPGHTRSWGASHPELLTACGGPYEGKLGPINPIIETNYDFIYDLFEEVFSVFPDKYTHLGGDEVGFECWETNQDIIDYMKTYNITSFPHLEEFYIQKLIDKVTSMNVNSIVWQEVYTNGVRLPKGTVVHIWTGNQRKLLAKVKFDFFFIFYVHIKGCKKWYFRKFCDQERNFVIIFKKFNGQGSEEKVVLKWFVFCKERFLKF